MTLYVFIYVLYLIAEKQTPVLQQMLYHKPVTQMGGNLNIIRCKTSIQLLSFTYSSNSVHVKYVMLR